MAHRSKHIWTLLLSTAVLYAAFGLIFGMMQGGLPPIMRARGIDLASVGWTYIVLVPFGLTFLWAPLIDAVRPISTLPRIGWIAVMQVITVLLLLIVANGEALPPMALLALGLGIAFAAATMDVALDALATSSVPAEYRASAGGLKVAALAVGAMAGGGAFVASATGLGWSTTFYICAAVFALATIPIWVNRSWDQKSDASDMRAPRFLTVISRPETRRRMLLLTLATCSIVPLIFLNRIMLVDLGVSLQTIGWIVGTGAPLFGLVASLVAIPIIRKTSAQLGLLLFAAVCLVAAACLFLGAARGNPTLGIVGAIAMNAGGSGLFVIFCATTLGWAKGSQPATDYAALYGVSRLAATVLLIGLTRLVAVIGWPAFYGCAGAFLVLTTALFRTALPREAVATPHSPSGAGDWAQDQDA